LPSNSFMEELPGATKPLKRVSKDEWEALGLEKRTDYENLRRVFERIAGTRGCDHDELLSYCFRLAVTA